jgi:hypothetical protein
MDKLLRALHSPKEAVPHLHPDLKFTIPRDQVPLWQHLQAGEGEDACPECKGPLSPVTSWSKRNVGKRFRSCRFCENGQWETDDEGDGPLEGLAPIFRTPAALAMLGFRTPVTCGLAGAGSPAAVQSPARPRRLDFEPMPPNLGGGPSGPAWHPDLRCPVCGGAVQSLGLCPSCQGTLLPAS